MCASGIADLEQFQRNEGHWAYIDQAVRDLTFTHERTVNAEA